MQRVPSFIVIILFLINPALLLAAGVKDSAVPPGWAAGEYDEYGNDLLNKNQYALSRKYFDAAIRLQPTRWTAYYNRATAFACEGNWRAALADLNETIRLEPAFFLASWMRALVYLRLRDYSDSLKDLNALEKVTFQVREPGELALVLSARSWLRSTCPNASYRNGQLAIADAKRACDLQKWKNSQYLDSLAAAYAELGDFGDAIRYQQQAIALDKSGNDEALKSFSKNYAQELANGNPERLKGYARRLELYKQHRPYRENP